MYKSKFFTDAELQCPCCGKVVHVPEFERKLDELREWIGVPVYISKGGGYRCAKYNLKAGGHKNSAHKGGLAVDIRCIDAVSRYTLVEVAILHNFTGIGIYDKHVHLDIAKRVGNACVIWMGISK